MSRPQNTNRRTAAVKRPVSVKRYKPRTRVIEAIAAIAVIALMVGVFFIVGPSNAIASSDQIDTPSIRADFRDETPHQASIERIGRVTGNATATDVLEVLGASQDDAKSVMAVLRDSKLIKRERLPRGTQITAFFDDEDLSKDSAARLVGVSVKLDATHSVVASRRADGSFFTTTLTARLTVDHRRIAGTIKTTLGDAIVAAGGDRAHARRFATLFPEDEQLSNGGRKGERFDIVYEVVTDERGTEIETGDLVFAAFNGKEASGSWYAFAPDDTEQIEFFNVQGTAAQALLSSNPLGDARITSSFGKRVHPLTGAEHLHSGTDFAGTFGTPIYAAGDGTIQMMGYGNGYGRHVRIRHTHGFMTLYAHMSGFVSTLEAGDRVQQGDLIGYVGASGSATGPHLHYEVRQNGRILNPMRFKRPEPRDLTTSPEMMQAFQERRQEIDMLRGATMQAETLGAQDVRLAP